MFNKKWLLFLFMMSFVSLVNAHSRPRVMVSPFESEVMDKELARKLTIAVAKDIMQAKEYIYKSPTEIISEVFGVEKMGGIKFSNLDEEYSEKRSKQLDKITEFQLDKITEFQRGFELLDKWFKVADITVGGKIERNEEDKLKVEVMAFDMKDFNHDTYTDDIECYESQLNEEVVKAVRPLLKRILKGEKVSADKLIDKKMSKVIYVLSAIDRKKIEVEADYTGDRPNPELSAVKILPLKGISTKGVTTFQLKSQEGDIIEIIFDYKFSKLNKVMVNTDIPDLSKMDEQSETLTVKSVAGYILKFEFLWDKGEMQSVKLYPVINPFSGNEQDVK